MVADKNANVDVLTKLAAFAVLLLEFFMLCYLSVPFLPLFIYLGSIDFVTRFYLSVFLDLP
jgi:hypothetical protein